MKEGLETEAQGELPPNEQKINELLKRTFIKDELIETREIASLARRENLQDLFADYVSAGILSGNTPQFLHIVEFYSALYNRRNKIVHLDAWNVSHDSIAAKKDMLAKDKFGHQYAGTASDYTSGDVFVLEGAGDIKIMIIDSLFGFGAEDLSIIRNLGYSVLSPNRNWLFEESNKTGNKIINIPSSISTGLD